MKQLKLFAFLTLFVLACEQRNQPPSTQLSEADQRLPENALYGIEAAEGLEVQLFAAEPMVRNPSNIDVDHRGRVWVIENVNYRPDNNPDLPNRKEGDQVIILEDSDGDGKADRRTVFFQDPLVDGAMGIGVFGNRIYLSSSPHLLILTDDNDDGQADRIDTLFTGMGNKQHDHTIHAVSFGPDGRLYFNYGNASPEMLRKDGSPVIDKMGNEVNGTGNPYWHGMVFRCEMDGASVESLGHNFRNNYEVCVDSYGRMWQSDNDDDGNRSVRINYVIEYGNFGYRDELTGAPWQTSRTGQHSEVPFRHWHQNDPGVIPNLLITGSGSPCGITVYEGDLLPSRFHRQIIHADAGPGIVRAYPIVNSGAGFIASQDPVLTRTTDSWFRPTDVSVAPDGSLFISDWYDPGVGGHWAGDLDSRGRIYRVAPSIEKYSVPVLNFDTPASSVKALKSPNSATRYLAWSAIDKMGDVAESELRKMWVEGKPIFRARALWLLSRLDESVISGAMQDEDEMIRTTAVRVARQLVPEKLTSLLKPLVRDESAKVRREIAVALREVNSPEVPDMWTSLALQHDGRDRWYLEALGIGATGRWNACFENWLTSDGNDWDKEAGRDIIWRSRASQTFDYLLQIMSKTDIPAAELARYLRATDFVETKNKDERLAELMIAERMDKEVFQMSILTHLSPEYVQKSPEVRQAIRSLLPSIRGTRQYLDVVRNLDLQNEIPWVFQMVIDNPNHELGVNAAILVQEMHGWKMFADALKGQDREAIVGVLRHINSTPAKNLLKQVILDDDEDIIFRKKAIDALAFDWGWEARLIGLLEEDLPGDLTTAVATKLVSAVRPVDRAVGLKYLETLPAVHEIAPVSDLITRTGNSERGKEVFGTFCITCHRVRNTGIEFGPELSDIGNKLGPEGLYSSVIYPDAAISHGFEGVHFELKDGSHWQGYILNETGETIELRIQGGMTKRLQKDEIKTSETMSNSLMTAGLAESMGEEKLVDLASYLITLKETLDSNPFQGKVEFERDE